MKAGFSQIQSGLLAETYLEAHVSYSTNIIYFCLQMLEVFSITCLHDNKDEDMFSKQLIHCITQNDMMHAFDINALLTMQSRASLDNSM
jgi:hypothetical protein